MPTTSDLIQQAVDAARMYGKRQIIVLSGVPATSKSYIARQVALEVASHALMIREVQFHPSFSYESFVEGYQPRPNGGFDPALGVFAEWAGKAQEDLDKTQADGQNPNIYVLVIEELSRANVPAVLGELMTYIEHRDRSVWLPINQRALRVPENLIVIATMNPRDRSALELDDAVYRRLRVLTCPPDATLLPDVLGFGATPSEEEKAILNGLETLFKKCEERYPENFADEMPFGHAAFAGVQDFEDLRNLWDQQLRHLLNRPGLSPHPFYETIRDEYQAMLMGVSGPAGASSANPPADPSATATPGP